MRSTLERETEIANAYSLYITCRSQQVYEYEFEQNGKGMRMLLEYTTGLSILPYEGGVMDQPERLMAFFDEFLMGDQIGFHRRIDKKH